jgi:hypothetical protein
MFASFLIFGVFLPDQSSIWSAIRNVAIVNVFKLPTTLAAIKGM